MHALLTLTCLLAPAGAEPPAEPADFPKTAPPEFVMVSRLNEGTGTVYVRSVRTVPVTVTKTVEMVVMGEKRTVTVPVTEYRTEVVERALPLKSLRVFDAAGKELKPAEARKRLTPGKMVLRATDSKPLAPAYRKVLARDALILVPAAGKPGPR
jgi:hypothetical protein